MPKDSFRYTYDDLRSPENNCVLVTMKQVSEKCGLSASTIRGIFKTKTIHYDSDRKFRIDKRKYEKAKSKIRKQL